jgi:hypothetical protein
MPLDMFKNLSFFDRLRRGWANHIGPLCAAPRQSFHANSFRNQRTTLKRTAVRLGVMRGTKPMPPYGP